jgi:serine/threonine protein kinase
VWFEFFILCFGLIVFCIFWNDIFEIDIFIFALFVHFVSQGGGGTPRNVTNLELTDFTDAPGHTSSYRARRRHLEDVSAYRFERLLGYGAFGTTFLAKAMESNKYYVIKIVPSLSKSMAEINAAMKEATTMERVRTNRFIISLAAFFVVDRRDGPLPKTVHDSLVDLSPAHNDITKHELTLWLVMPFCASGDLRQWIKRQKNHQESYSQNDALTWMFDLMQAIEALHAVRLIHRDVKPLRS